MDRRLNDGWFSREALAGYSPSMLSRRVLVLGAGALGNALSQQLVMWGFHKVTWVDPDTYEPSNATRTLDFPHALVRRGRSPSKSCWVASQMRRRLRAAGFETNAVVACRSYLQELPPRHLNTADVVLAAVDHPRARFDAAMLAHRYQKPMFMGGFDAPTRTMTVHVHPASHEAACYRCGLSSEPAYGVSDNSCTATGLRALEKRSLPATPTAASACAALMMQQLVDGLSRGFGNAAYTLQAALGRDDGGTLGHRYALRRSPDCPAHHHDIAGDINPRGTTLLDLVEAIDRTPGRVLLLPAPLPIHVVADDGAAVVRVARPPWRCIGTIAASEFPPARDDAYVLALEELDSDVVRQHGLETMPASWFGYGPGAVIEVLDDGQRTLIRWSTGVSDAPRRRVSRGKGAVP